MKKNNCLDFYYPKSVGQWHWEWWFNIYGGFRHWLYHKHETINKNKTNKWTLEIILGFKRITREWLIGPDKALLEWKKGRIRLVNHIFDLVNNPEKYGLDKEDDIEETRLFK